MRQLVGTVFIFPDLSNASGADSHLDLSEATSEELESQVQRARAELEALRERQNQIEKERKRLEELSQRQEELEEERTDIVDKLNRALSLIESETDTTERHLEQLNSTYKSFKEHLQGVAGINPRLWSSNDLPEELGRASSLVAHARSNYSLMKSKFMSEPNYTPGFEALVTGNKGTFDSEVKGFFYWLKSGFAFTLPLILFGILALLVVFWTLGGAHRR
jgi:uncharacterized protein YhaN